MARDEMSLLDQLEESIRLFTHMRRQRFWMGVVVVVMAFGTLVQTAYYSYQQRQCNEAIEAHLVNRAQWADEDREALRTLIVSVFENDADPVQFRAYENWVAVTEGNNRARARISLPSLASDC